MKHADGARRMSVRANADTAEDAARARRFGAQGIGLCRTEHMFLGERRQLVERLILADSDEEQEKELVELLPLQREDFVGILEAMDGLPVTIRLLDPPLHEFLPDITELSVRVAVAEARGEKREGDLRMLQAVHKLHEQNPMLGLRGVRLGVVIPGLFQMQARAILEAAAERIKAGGVPRVEIMVPLVANVQEFETVKQDIIQVAREVRGETGVHLEFLIGTMIELPRAALTADQIAEAAEFFSFGTNDLTQTTWGFSRDDVEAAFFSAYLEKGIFGVSPFESIDREGVGELDPHRRRAWPVACVPASSWASAASTAATPNRSTSSKTSASTTCPARRSASRSPASRRAGRCPVTEQDVLARADAWQAALEARDVERIDDFLHRRLCARAGQAGRRGRVARRLAAHAPGLRRAQLLDPGAPGRRRWRCGPRAADRRSAGDRARRRPQRALHPLRLLAPLILTTAPGGSGDATRRRSMPARCRARDIRHLRPTA